jgi:hypothetical protein
VVEDIEGRVGGKVLSTEVWEAENSPFADARKTIAIALDANMSRGGILKNRSASESQVSSNANIVNSQRLSMDYAKKVISSCKEVSRFYLYLYELNQGYSLHQDGEIRADQCFHGEYSGPSSLPWVIRVRGWIAHPIGSSQSRSA